VDYDDEGLLVYRAKYKDGELIEEYKVSEEELFMRYMNRNKNY